VQDQGSSLEAQQQVLGAPADRSDPLAGKLTGNVLGNGPSKPPVVNAQFVDPIPGQRTRNAASRGFNLGQFWHRQNPVSAALAGRAGQALACRGYLILVSL